METSPSLSSFSLSQNLEEPSEYQTLLSQCIYRMPTSLNLLILVFIGNSAWQFIKHIANMSLILGGGRRSNIFDPFSLDIWDPFDGFPFSTTLANPPTTDRETSAIVNARIDWKETPEAHIFKADLPGLNKEEVKVEVEEGRVLQIRGEKSREQEEKTDKWHRVERSVGKFLRRFRLPENAKIDQVKASMENGVLTVVVPKEEEKKSEVKSIDISG